MTPNPMAQTDVYRMIRRRAFAAGIKTRIGNHTFRATGITQYLGFSWCTRLGLRGDRYLATENFLDRAQSIAFISADE